jgi:hypothetical protein
MGIPLDEIEVGSGLGCPKLRHPPLVDEVGVGDDLAAGCDFHDLLSDTLSVCPAFPPVSEVAWLLV